MAQSSYNTYTVNDQYWKAYDESWETKKPYVQSYFDQHSMTYQYQQPMSHYHGDNRKSFGQISLTHKNTTGRKGISYGYNGNNETIANGGNVCVPRPRPAQQLAVPRSTTARSRPSVPILQPTTTRSQLPSAISRPPSPTCQSPSPNSRSFPPISRPPTPRPRSTSLRCRPPSQQTQTMHDPSAFTNHQFQTQYGNQMESHNNPCQLFYYQEDESWNRPEICHTDFYQLPPSRVSEIQPLIEREKNDVNYSGHFQRHILINGTKQILSEYSIQAQINERRQVSTSTSPPTEEHNQNSVEYFQRDGRYKNEPSAQITFLPIQESSQTKYENDKSSIKPRTGCWQGKSESRRVIRTGQYRKTPYSTKNIVTPTNIRSRSTERTPEKESNIHLPIYGSVSPFPKSDMNISKSGIVTPLLRAPYLEYGTASTDYPATCPDRDRRVVIQCSTLGGTAGADMRLKYDRVLPGYQIPQQLARPVKQSGHMADSTHSTSWRTNSDLTNDMRLSCQEPNQTFTGLHPTSIGNQNCTNSAKETFASHAAEQYHDSENDICKTAFTDEIPTEISTPSEKSDRTSTKGKERRPKHLQREEPLHLGKETVAEVNANNTTGITDSPKAAESKDEPQNNATIASLIDRLLKEARTASDLLQQQGEWKQEHTTGRICIAKSKGGRPNTSGRFETCGNKSDIKDKMTPFSRTSRSLHPGTGRKQNEIGISKEISLLMSELRICGNKVGPAKEPASSGTCPPVKKDLDSDKEEEEKRCVIKAKPNSLSLTMNTSNGGVDRVIRIISSEDLVSTPKEPNRSMKGGKRVLRQEEEEKGEKEDSLVNDAKKAQPVFSELSENTKRAGSSLSEENITRAKRSKHEGDVTMSTLIQREKNMEPEVKSTKRNVDENENGIEPKYSSQDHEVTVSCNDALVSRKKRTIQEAEEDSVPKLPCISQEPVRSLSKQESSKYSFISEDHNIPVNGTKIIESDNETRKLVKTDTFPENETRKTNDDSKDNDNKAKRRKQEGGVRKSVLIQEEKNIKRKEEDKKRKVGGNGDDIKPSYSDREYDAAASSKNEDLEYPKNIKRRRVDETSVLKSSCFSHKHKISLSEQESSNKSVISEDSEININGPKKFESDDETKKPVLKDFIPEHEQREINDNNDENEDQNSLSLRQEPERPSSLRQGSANNFGTLLQASADNADISLITSVRTHENESGPERVRKSKRMRKTRKRHTVVNELKPAESNSLIELFKLLRI